MIHGHVFSERTDADISVSLAWLNVLSGVANIIDDPTRWIGWVCLLVGASLAFLVWRDHHPRR